MVCLPQWFYTQATAKETAVLTICTGVFSLLYSIGLGIIVDFPFTWTTLGGLGFSQLILLFRDAIGEEVMFRLIPLSLSIYFWGKTSFRVLIIAIGTSLLFGYLHHGPFTTAIIGIPSFSFSLLYMKCGGLHGNRDQALAAVCGAHILNNLTYQCIGSVISFMGT